MREKTKYVVVLIICIGLSVGGIVFSIHSREPLDGSRGGVLAVGLAVAYLVVKRDIAGEVFETLEEHVQEDTPPTDPGLRIDRLTRRFDDLKSSLRNKNKDEGGLNAYLAIATLIGTLAAAFGDLAAKFLIAKIPN